MRHHGDEPLAHLARPVALTRAGIVAERVTRAFWPFWTVLFAVLAPLMMGWHDVLPLELLWGYAVASVLGLIGTAVWGALRFRWPTKAEAVARVDAAMPGRPIATLADRQAIGAGDPASQAVWAAHLRRMADRTRGARAVGPDLRVSSRDPYGLRFMALILFVTALLFGSFVRVGTLPDVAGSVGPVQATGPVWEGWIEPPGYTRRPSLYLADIPPGPLSAPQGSRVTLRFYGDSGALDVTETVSGEPLPDGADPVPVASDLPRQFQIMQDGRIAIAGDDGAAWDVTVIPDLPPSVDLAGPIKVDALGEFSQPFRATDDFGVVSGRATITLDLDAVNRRHGLGIAPDPRDALVLDLPMPFSGDRSDFTQALIEDLSQHPFANLPVTLTLTVADASGQEVSTPPAALILPGRRFFQPLARAVIEQRRDLLWSRDNASRVVQILRAVSYRPEDIFTNQTTYLRLNTIIRRLDALSGAGALHVEEQDEIAQALWDLAVQLEDGTLADARERLRRAQERLSEAMRNGASNEEIAELMQELREATDDYLNMLAQNAEPGEDNTDQPSTAQQNGQQVTQDQIQALMDRIQELMEEGRMAEAAELMDQLNQLMENLRVTQGEGGGNGPRTPGQQSMQDLSETLREQQDLSDDAFRDLQEQFNGRQPGQQQRQPGQQSGEQGQGQDGEQQGPGEADNPQDGQPGANGQGSESRDGAGDGATDGTGRDPAQTLADRQQALRDELERQRGNLPGMDGDAAEAARRALERADGAMDGAEDALRNGRLAEAIDRQAEAMDALREGLRNLGQALAENDSNRQPGEGQAEGQVQGRVEPARRDPLGRQLGDSGQYGTDQNLLQGGDIYRRAEELLGEIRKRAAEQDRPAAERDYLKRLLDRF